VTEQRLQELRIAYEPGRKVASIDRRAKTISLSDGVTRLYVRLLLATGAVPRTLNVPIADTSRIATLRTHADATRIRTAITAGSTVAIVGGGFIGLEVAASAVRRGAAVAVIEAGPRILARAVPEAIARLIMAEHERHGVKFITGASIKGIENMDGKAAIRLSEETAIVVDIVVVGIGASPDVLLAQQAGLEVDNGVLVGPSIQTSDPDIYAAGDCCSFPHELYGKQIRLESWRNAERQGTLAGQNLAGTVRTYADVPWFWSDQYGLTLQVAGLVHDGDVAVMRDLEEKGKVLFHVSPGGKLVAACAFGSIGAIAKEIRFAEKLIAHGAILNVSDLSNPAVSLKSLV
jgi:3-phenylpropionate/trans-cinnamate dioxygenase ferredoxin reductase subunit